MYNSMLLIEKRKHNIKEYSPFIDTVKYLDWS